MQTMYCEAGAAAAHYAGEVDVIGASPSCTKVSNANAEVSEQEAKDEMEDSARIIVQAAQRMQAKVVLIEESDGLRTRWGGRVFAAFTAVLASAEGFRWRHGKVDARALGAAHTRVRLGWVGSRVETTTDGNDGGS